MKSSIFIHLRGFGMVHVFPKFVQIYCFILHIWTGEILSKIDCFLSFREAVHYTSKGIKRTFWLSCDDHFQFFWLSSRFTTEYICVLTVNQSHGWRYLHHVVMDVYAIITSITLPIKQFSLNQWITRRFISQPMSCANSTWRKKTITLRMS